MSFDALIQKVKQAETALETSERRTVASWKDMKLLWKEGWTPGRIMVAGLASGFLVGRSKPLRLAGSGGVLNMVTALAGLFATGRAQAAADEAGPATDAAGNVAPQAANQAASTSTDNPFDTSSA